ncbi:hypothetical protein NADFUDRAFT_45658 [Nadsonia fulvescens var. elongata DSM 6958]|uniref:PCI domain-containing protein n=1 Tax=Nadsonia fulvescens var. elongata DSM 6958 TaxID=857566 RepID=A0A1E3PRL9_9ASCO|nr:hypothetical protein NADFUDRAFT_45658 [Nadsonia fulvescens var. elongata DSM 6958]
MSTDIKPETPKVEVAPVQVVDAEEVKASVINDIKQSFTLLERGATTFDSRFILKVFRDLPALRKRVNATILSKIVGESYPDSNESKNILLKFIGEDTPKDNHEMEIDFTSNPATPEAVVTITPTEILPEVDMFLHLLIQVWLLNRHEIEPLKAFNEFVVTKLKTYNRRSLDQLSAKIWFYYARAKELSGQLDEIRPVLLNALGTATIRHDTETQASLITLLLRNYVVSKNFNQAANLVSKTNFPESAGNALAARYLYYLGRINAIQLDYSSAHDKVIGAIRKAPQTKLASGFLQSANKLNIVIELLMGDIPERSIFSQRELERCLVPYFEITKAVRIGDITLFSETVEKHAEKLKQDGNYSLVLRLRQNVIKTGIRIMSLAYSRIPLKDICIRLHLDSEESAEYIVAKAIRDGVIEATIDHEKGFMQSKEVLDIYSTNEPQQTYHDRIEFCLGLHDDSVKSMRYPMSLNRFDLKQVEEVREREKELASEIQEGDFDEDDDDDFEL